MTVTGTVENGQIILAAPLDLPNGTSVEVELRLISAEFWKGVPLDELAKRQGILAPPALADLAGDWPEEDSIDEFLASVREGRN
jgi:hypothetical protein